MQAVCQWKWALAAVGTGPTHGPGAESASKRCVYRIALSSHTVPGMETASAADVAYETLRRAILDKALAPGTRLPEDELAAQFGVSRTPIRAVLARLQNEGLVSAGARRTASVAQPGLPEA